VRVVYGGANGLDLTDAGVHRLAMAFRDTRTYHKQNEGRWTPPQAVAQPIPAASCWSPPDPGFPDLVQYAWNRLGACVGEGDLGSTFYGATCPEHTRGGVVDTGGVQSDFLNALQGDDVVYADCHGSPGHMAICLPRGIYSTDIAGLPDGSFTDLELAYLSCCHSMEPGFETGYGPTPSLADAMHGRGAGCVVGYEGADWAPCPGGDFFNHRLWVHWTAGDSVGAGIVNAMADRLAEYGNLGYATNIRSVGNNELTIAPAFGLGEQ